MFLLIMSLSIIFDIPVLRQILGFIFLTFVPGWLILYILKLNKLGMTEKFVLSVGLSIAFTIFAGLLINMIYPLFGYPMPLTTNSLLISFGIITLILAVIAYFRNKDITFVNISIFQLNNTEKIYLLLPAIFPLLAVLGMRIMNVYGNNIMLMVLLSLIPVYIIFMAIMHNKVPDRVYAPIIFCVSISFLLMFAFVSNYIYGSDSHSEFFLFGLTMANGHWQVFQNSPLDSSLSISILPTVYQSFMNMNTEYLFKFIYVLPFSMTPLVIFIFSKKYLSNIYAFLSSIFLMAQYAFLSQTMAYRNYLAILFFGLSIMIIFHNQLSIANKRLLFIIFSVSVIMSHYSTAYIYFFLLLFTWIGCSLIYRITLFRKNPYFLQVGNPRNLSRDTFNRNSIPINAVMLIFIILFFWYGVATGAAFSSGVKFVGETVVHLQDMFNAEMRTSQVYEALGSTLPASITPTASSALTYLNFITSWLSVIFIAIGVLSLFIRQKYIKEWRMDIEFVILAFVCSTILAVSIILPYVLVGYSFGRMYYQCMVILSPFFVIGGTIMTRLMHIKTKWSYLIILAVLIPLSMNTSGILPQYISRPVSIILNSPTKVNDPYYIYDSDFYGAQWIEDYATLESITDYSGKLGLINPAMVGQLTQTENGYIFLGYDNVVNHIFLTNDNGNGETTSIVEIVNKFNNKNLIYCTNDSQIWK